MIKVPKYCLCCGAKYLGGYEVPNKPTKINLSIHYKCGARLIYNGYDGINEQLTFRNCCCSECEPDQ